MLHEEQKDIKSEEIFIELIQKDTSLIDTFNLQSSIADWPGTENIHERTDYPILMNNLRKTDLYIRVKNIVDKFSEEFNKLLPEDTYSYIMFCTSWSKVIKENKNIIYNLSKVDSNFKFEKITENDFGNLSSNQKISLNEATFPPVNNKTFPQTYIIRLDTEFYTKPLNGITRFEILNSIVFISDRSGIIFIKALREGNNQLKLELLNEKHLELIKNKGTKELFIYNISADEFKYEISDRYDLKNTVDFAMDVYEKAEKRQIDKLENKDDWITFENLPDIDINKKN